MAVRFDKTSERAITIARNALTGVTIPKSKLKKLVPLSGYHKPLAQLTPDQQAVIDGYKATLKAALKELQLLENELANPNITDDIAEEVTEAIAKQKEIINTAQYSIRGAKKAFYGEQLMSTTA